MNDREFIANVITDSRPLPPQPTAGSNTAHILLWCGLGAWVMAVVVTAAITFSNNNRSPSYPAVRERETPPRVVLPPTPAPTPIILTPRAQPVPTAPPTLPAAVPMPSPGDLRTYATLDRQIPFEIRSEAGSNHLLRLYMARDNRLAMSVFIHGGTTQTVKVPVGDFVVRVASGTRWVGYNDDDLFGPDTGFTRMDTVFSFEPGYCHWVTLYTVPDGNLRTLTIPRNEF